MDNNLSNKLAAAFVAFQSEITNPKETACNPFFNSKYAPLSEVLNTVRPILAKHGLCVLQSASSADGEIMEIHTTILHSSGEKYEAKPLSIKIQQSSLDVEKNEDGKAKKKKNAAQEIGGIITYLRRYALSSVLGISSEEDVDGEADRNQLNKKLSVLSVKKYTGPQNIYKPENPPSDITIHTVAAQTDIAALSKIYNDFIKTDPILAQAARERINVLKGAKNATV